MPVDTEHPDYTDCVASWKKYRHFTEGEKAVKREGVTYLPKRSKEKTQDYQERLAQTMFYNGTGRTVEGFIGALFRKEPVIEGDSTINDYVDDVTSAGQSWTSFARKVAEEMIKVNRGGILVDQPLEEERVSGTRSAYLSFFEAEDIINWKTKRINGKEVATLIVLKETVPKKEEDLEDEFDQEMDTRYRKLAIEDGQYIVEIYREAEEGGSIVLEETIFPTYRGSAMDFIPFIPFNITGVNWDIKKSMIADLVEVNHSHYINSSQYETALKFVASPFLFLRDPGRDSDPEIVLGSTKAYFTTDPQAECKFIELEGKSIPELKTAMEEKEKKMAVMGARLLEEQKAGVEAFETVRLRQAGESGILGNMSQALAEILEECFKMLIRWDRKIEEPKVIVTVNRDFTSSRLSSQDIQVLLQARMAGEISRETFIFNLLRGEVLEEGRTVDEEIDAINRDGPTPGGLEDEEEDPENPDEE